MSRFIRCGAIALPAFLTAAVIAAMPFPGGGGLRGKRDRPLGGVGGHPLGRAAAHHDGGFGHHPGRLRHAGRHRRRGGGLLLDRPPHSRERNPDHETDDQSGVHARGHGDNGGGAGGGGRGPGVGEALPAAEHSPAVLGRAHQRHAGRHGLRAALRSHHRAGRLLRDHRGEQGRRRWRHGHLRGDRGQPPARPDHARPVRVRHRHHRKPHQGRNVQLHRQGDRREPDLHAGLPDHRHGARPPGPAAVQRR